MRRIYKSLLCFILILGLAACSFALAEEQSVSFPIYEIQKHGNLILAVHGSDFLAAGYDYGDIISAEIAGKEYTMPVGSNYSDVDSGEAVCRVKIDPESGDDAMILAINMGNLASDAGIAEKFETEDDLGFYWEYTEGIETPVEVKISMQEKGGYRNQWLIRQLTRTNERSDYAHLSDADFANFRPIATTGMGENVIYRSSSPVNPEIGRNTYADAAMREAGIATVINLADSEISYEGWEDSYYHGLNITMLGLEIDFAGEDFINGLAKGMRAIIAGEAPFLVHCNEGKDRAGYVSALLECLMGASAEEVMADYMVTYFNYYGTEPGTEQYNAIVEDNICKTMAAAFGIEDIRAEGTDLSEEAREYMVETLKLTEEEVQALIAKLS